MELSYNQLSYLLRRYPKFEPSYETMSQKGNLNNYKEPLKFKYSNI